ncbi:hypothetical protein SUGI_1190810 [Cryptomeria japonica]|uniref:brassinosteroid-responsive RING protein 1-like n=1 Tax=Cryptomeria japonica TaxID=3369 RepID=UPI002414919D|nr:brassinosteroid-responsive RING protein 1-like [Cryptomeria japonica]GLJ55457.1 hypothetical protein SUGI_1190810 [Cryptomeria japonica]
MGFPVGFGSIAIPRVLLYTASAMDYLNNLICCFLSALQLSRTQQVESYSWQELSEFSSTISSTSGEMIKHKLPLIMFRNVAGKLTEIEKDIVCAVCLSPFEEEDEIRELCNCSHIFHRDCLDKWIDNHKDSCPFCRCPLLEPTVFFSI